MEVISKPLKRADGTYKVNIEDPCAGAVPVHHTGVASHPSPATIGQIGFKLSLGLAALEYSTFDLKTRLVRFWELLYSSQHYFLSHMWTNGIFYKIFNLISDYSPQPFYMITVSNLVNDYNVQPYV